MIWDLLEEEEQEGGGQNKLFACMFNLMSIKLDYMVLRISDISKCVFVYGLWEVFWWSNWMFQPNCSLWMVSL